MEQIQINIEDLTCPLLLTLLEDPITLPCCGKSVSRAPIIQWLNQSHHKVCPVCKSDISNFDALNCPKAVNINYMIESLKNKSIKEVKQDSWTTTISTFQNGQTVIGKLEIRNDNESHKFKTLVLSVIDCSGSMSGGPIKQCQYSLNRMIDLSYKNKQLISNVITYHDRAKNYTIDTNELIEVYRQEAAKLGLGSGGTSFTAAFDEIIKVITLHESNSEISSLNIVFLTDGEDSSIQKDKRGQLVTSLKDRIINVWSKPFTVHSIGFGQQHDSDFLDKLRKIGTTEGSYRYADPQEDNDSLSNKINSVLNVIAESSTIPLTLVQENIPPIIHSDNGIFWLNLTNYDLTKTYDFAISVNNQEPIILQGKITESGNPKTQSEWLSILIDQIAAELITLSNQKNYNGLDKEIHCELLEQRGRAIACKLDSTSDQYSRLEKLMDTLKSIKKNEDINHLKLMDAQFEGKFKTENLRNPVSVPQGSINNKLPQQINYNKKVWETIPKLSYKRCNSSDSSKEFMIVIGKCNNKGLTEWITNNRNNHTILQKDSHGSNMLHVMASVGRSVIKHLINLRIFDINATNDDGFNALDLAIIYEKWKTVETLILNGGKPNKDLDLLLQTCISNKDYKTASLLLTHKITVVTQDLLDNCPTAEGLTWLSARSNTDIPVEKAILKGLFDIVSNKIDTITTISWKPYLEIFQKPTQEHILIIDLLLQNKKADPDEIIETIEINLEDGKDTVWPLFLVSEKGSTPLFKILMKYISGQDAINRQTSNGTTCLWIASCNRHIDIVMDLLNNGANPNIPNHKGDSALIPACQKGNDTIVELLLEAGIDMFLHNKERDNAILISCRTNQSKILDMLLRKLNPKQLNEMLTYSTKIDGFPPVLAATELDKAECIKVCLKYGADIEWRTANDNEIIAGATALHLASFYGRLSALKTLVEFGADIKSQTNTNLQTALHIAIKQKHIHIVRYLLSLEKGRECLSIPDSDDKLPSYYAFIQGNDELLNEFFTNRLAISLGKIFNHDSDTELKCANTLLKYGQSLGCYEYSDITNIDLDHGSTALTYSLLNGNNILLNTLKSMNANMNKKDDFGISPAFWEAYLGLNNNPSPEITEMLDNVNSAKKYSIQNKMLLSVQQGGPKMIDGGKTINSLLKMNDGYGANISKLVLATLKANQGVEQSLMGFVEKLKTKKEFVEGEQLLNYLIWDAKINVIKRCAIKTDLQPVHLLSIYLMTSNLNLLQGLNNTLINWNNKSVWHPFALCFYDAISKIEPFIGEVYRGVDCSPFDPETYKINNIVEWNAFSVCSSEFRTASDLIKQNKGIIFIIQSLTGRKIDRYSKNPAECEVIFNPGSQFKVKAYYKASLICLGQKNIRDKTFKISDKDIERAIKGECIIIELEEVDKSILSLK